MALNLSVSDGSSTVGTLVNLRTTTNGLGSGSTCGTTVLTERRRNSATVKSNVTIPRTGADTIGTPTLTTVAIGGNISCNTPSNGPSSLLFVVTTARSNSIRLRVLSHLVIVLVSPSFATGLETTGDISRFLRAVSTRRGVGCPSRRIGPTRGRTPGNCEVLNMATYPANVTRACVTTRTLRGGTGRVNCSVGIRASNSNNTGGILAGGRVRRYSNVVITTSGGIRVTEFSNGGILGASISSNVGGPNRLVREIISKGIPICRDSNDRRPSSSRCSRRGRDFNHGVCGRLVGNISRVLPFIINNNILVTLKFLVSAVTKGTGINNAFNFAGPITSTIF